MTTATPFDGAVLCGGSSTRMGRDKALVEIDGLPMYRRVLDALTAAGAAALAVVGGDEDRLAGDHAFVADRWPGEGPLGGIVTALRSPGQASVVAVLSCDLLTPDPAAITALVDARAATGCDVAVPVVDGRPQWTHAVWHRRVTALLSAHLEAGTRSIHGAVAGCTICRVKMGPTATADADRPEDLPEDLPDDVS